MIATILLAVLAGTAIVGGVVGIALWRPQKSDTSASGNDLSAYGAHTDIDGDSGTGSD